MVELPNCSSIDSTLFEFLSTDLSYFEIDAAQKLTNLKNVEPQLFEKLDPGFLFATVRDITSPCSIDEFLRKKQSVGWVLLNCNNNPNGINGITSETIGVIPYLLEDYGIFSPLELSILQGGNKHLNLSFLIEYYPKLNLNYVSIQDKLFERNEVVASLLEMRANKIPTALVLGKFRSPKAGLAEFLECARLVAQFVAVGYQSRDTILKNDPRLVVVDFDPDRAVILASFSSTDAVFEHNPPEKFASSYYDNLVEQIRPHFYIIGGEDHYLKLKLEELSRQIGFILLWKDEHDPSTTSRYFTHLSFLQYFQWVDLMKLPRFLKKVFFNLDLLNEFKQLNTLEEVEEFMKSHFE